MPTSMRIAIKRERARCLSPRAVKKNYSDLAVVSLDQWSRLRTRGCRSSCCHCIHNSPSTVGLGRGQSYVAHCEVSIGDSAIVQKESAPTVVITQFESIMLRILGIALMLVIGCLW